MTIRARTEDKRPGEFSGLKTVLSLDSHNFYSLKQRMIVIKIEEYNARILVIVANTNYIRAKFHVVRLRYNIDQMSSILNTLSSEIPRCVSIN